MNRKETAKILAVLEVTYPSFYKDKSEEELNDVVSIWAEMFKEEPYELVATILKDVIATSEYPPTIATIKKKISEIVTVDKESNMDLWNRLLEAIGRSGYYAEEEYRKLPSILKEFVGNPKQLEELSQMDSETVHSVVKGQFLKQIEILKEREKTKQNLSPELKQLLFGDKKMLEDVK